MVEFIHKMQSLCHVRLGHLLNQIKLRNHIQSFQHCSENVLAANNFLSLCSEFFAMYSTEI